MASAFLLSSLSCFSISTSNVSFAILLFSYFTFLLSPCLSVIFLQPHIFLPSAPPPLPSPSLASSSFFAMYCLFVSHLVLSCCLSFDATARLFEQVPSDMTRDCSKSRQVCSIRWDLTARLKSARARCNVLPYYLDFL
jgi:hypothetical protein